MSRETFAAGQLPPRRPMELVELAARRDEAYQDLADARDELRGQPGNEVLRHQLLSMERRYADLQREYRELRLKVMSGVGL